MDIESLRQLIREEYDVIDANDTISKIIPMLEKWEERSAILVKEDDKIIGVVRERDLIRGSVMVNPHETKVKNFVVRTGILSLNELTPENVARRFVEDSTPFVIVRVDGKHGVIFIDDFLKLLKKELKGIKVKEIMNPDVITIKDKDSVAKALAVMRTNGIDRLVVVDDSNKVVGIITGKDIVDRVLAPRKKAKMGDYSGEKERTLSITVESVMSYPVITAGREDSVAKVIDLMIENGISSVVIAKDGKPEGIVIKKDILETFIRKATPKEYDVQLILKDVELDDFEMSRIRDDLERFMDKFKEFFGESVLFVYMKRHKEYFRGLPLIHVRMKLTSDKGTYIAVGEGWGAEYALHATIRKLEREIMKEKEILRDKKMIRRFYENVFSEFTSTAA